VSSVFGRRVRARRGPWWVLLLGLASGAFLSLLSGRGQSEHRLGSEPALLAAAPAVAAPPRGLAGPEVPPEILARVPDTRALLDAVPSLVPDEPGASSGMFELVDPPDSRPDLAGPLRVEYAFDEDLTRRVYRVLERGHVRLGHVILLDPATGRILAYAFTDRARFSPTRIYPAASLIKVVTAAATLHHAPKAALEPCRFLGSPYILTRQRVRPPAGARATTMSFRDALAMSNNQCFAQLAVNQIGADHMIDAIERFGFLQPAAPGHAAGRADAGTDNYSLGLLGCGLAGCDITPLHAARLGASLARGALVEPRWIDAVYDAHNRRLATPLPRPARAVMTPELASDLRHLLVATTETGTARRAFQSKQGPALGDIRVAGKTGSLSGPDPKGHYSWFVGAAPAEAPSVAIVAVVVREGARYRSGSHLAAEALREFFCSDGPCSAENARRWLPPEQGLLARPRR
jgi:hypothetical protein